MIDAFESSFRIQPNAVFFWFVDESGTEISYTYQNARLISAALAQRLQDMNVHPGDTIVADLPNSPEFVFLVLASIYGGFSLALLNNTSLENARMVRALEGGPGNTMQLNAAQLKRLLPHIKQFSNSQGSGRIDQSAIIAGITNTRRERAIMGEKEDLVQDTVHFAERAAHIFNEASLNVTFLTGSKNSSKIVPHTWAQLVSASKDVIELVASPDGGWQARLPLESEQLSQCVLPLHSVDGFQLMVRAILQQHPFRLYEKFDAETVLRDAERYSITQVSLRENMLQDMLAIEEWRLDETPNRKSRLTNYEVILLCNRSLNARTLERAIEMNANVFATFGMTETCGTIAATLVNPGFQGGLKVGKNTTVRIVDANMQGFGSLAVRGGAVFKGYAGANTPMTVDHYFMTGDTAALFDGYIYVRNRSADMFNCAGENIYPAEIADVLCHVSGVAMAYVFGEEDLTGNKIPVAVVQQLPGAELTPEYVISTAQQWLAPHSVPTQVLVVDELPRTAGDKLDRLAVEQLFLSNLCVKSTVVHHVRMPLKYDVAGEDTSANPSGDLLILELRDARGRVGLGECTQIAEASYITGTLLPALIGETVRHPRTAGAVLAALPQAEEHACAVAAVEMALWDLYGQAVKRPLWQLLNEEYQRIWTNLGLQNHHAAPASTPTSAAADNLETHDGAQAFISAGAIIGISSAETAVARCQNAVQAGYNRVKLSITPNGGQKTAQAIKQQFPDLLLTLDAHCSFTDADIETLRAFDSLGVGWIEDPLNCDCKTHGNTSAAGVGACEDASAGGHATTNAGATTSADTDALSKLAKLQKQLATPICVSNSYANINEAYKILNFPELRCIAVEISKFGGIQPALVFLVKAKALGREACITSAQGSGISRRANAALCTLPDMIFPSDIGSTTNLFDADIAHPPYAAIGGTVILNMPGFESGIGCKLDLQTLTQAEVGNVVIK